MTASADRVCAREPIHIPGSIQPHGYLVAIDLQDGTIVQLSANWHLLVGKTPEQLLGKGLDELMGREQTAALQLELSKNSLARVELKQRCFEVLSHEADGLRVIEFEPLDSLSAPSSDLQLKQINSVARLQESDGLPQLFQRLADSVAEISGYDRVMVYRFHTDWHGEVIAEHVSAGVESYLGLHYPASDIPEQARRLYTQSWHRTIADAGYTPVPLVPSINPVTGRPLDLTHSVLRSVSPVHCEYLRNMGVAASMSLSLILEGRLWGLIACHHRNPHRMSLSQRIACELVARVASVCIGAREKSLIQDARLEARGMQGRLFERVAEESSFVTALVRHAEHFLGFVQASGAVITIRGEHHRVGKLPPETVVQRCLALVDQEAIDLIYATDCLASKVPECQAHAAVASGLLAIRLTEAGNEWLLWFRAEITQRIRWAGNPDKDTKDIDLPIQPRRSFAEWVQNVAGHSAPWTEIDIAAAQELRAAINASILRRTDELLTLNKTLEAKNADLDSFAYIASHDLREPLRGIRNHLEFFQEDFQDMIGPEGCERVSAIGIMAERLHEMLGALLRYTRVSRQELTRDNADMVAVIRRAIQLSNGDIAGNEVTYIIPDKLPSARCDAVMMSEVFANLFTNAVKYNLSGDKRIEISAERISPERVVFSVADNGIGIPEKNRDEVFKIFRRLHSRGEYGGGLGAGLTVVRAIVERHGGEVNFDSEPGKGTTFHVTLDSEVS